MRRPGRTSWVATAALATAALGGCFGDTTTEFPPGLEPLEDDTAPAQQGGSYTETLTMVDGELTNYTWVHGRGYILADPGTVWAASKDVDVMASACSTDTYSAEVGVEPEYEYGFRISYEVDQVITIAWDELWRYGTIEGTPSLRCVFEARASFAGRETCVNPSGVATATSCGWSSTMSPSRTATRRSPSGCSARVRPSSAGTASVA